MTLKVLSSCLEKDALFQCYTSCFYPLLFPCYKHDYDYYDYDLMIDREPCRREKINLLEKL